MHQMDSVKVSNKATYGVTSQDLYKLFLLKYGDPEETGWAPRRRLRFGYYQPADHYEALVNKLVSADTNWLDVGGGRDLFPNNRRLAQTLSERAHLLVGVDPSDNIESNTFLNERAKCLIEEYKTDHRFDLVTLRMVVEHVTNPSKVVQSVNRILRIGGMVVVFTVNLWSTVTVISRLLPFKLHYPIKKLFWGGEEKDTFPTVYKMNTRRRLRTVFGECGFEERYFAYLDDLSVFGRFKFLNYVELLAWRVLRRLRLRYPENCLLGIYEKIDACGCPSH